MQMSDRVRNIIGQEYISEAELERMVRASAPYTGHGMNRRFHFWLFDIRDGVCHDMRHEHPVSVGKSTGNGTMEEECEQCENGYGCPSCRWIGSVVRHL